MEIKRNTDQQFARTQQIKDFWSKNKFFVFKQGMFDIFCIETKNVWYADVWYFYWVWIWIIPPHFIEVTLVYQGRHSQQTMAMDALTKKGQ